MEIIKYPNEILRKKSVQIFKGDKEALDLLKEAEQYLRENENCGGLALPQLGCSKRGFVAKVKNRNQVFINPIIKVLNSKTSQASLHDPEGCMSLEGEWVTVPRPLEIEVMFMDYSMKKFRKEVFRSVDAVAILHENDHLNGILIIDYKNKESEETAV